MGESFQKTFIEMRKIQSLQIEKGILRKVIVTPMVIILSKLNDI